MKRLKQIFAMALAMIMMLAMSVPAMADGAAATGYTITITNASGTYKAYQVFNGDLTLEDGQPILSNIAWGNGVTQFEYNGTSDAKGIAAYLAGQNETVAKEFAATAAANIIEADYTKEVTAGDGTATINDLPAGYYVILNSNVGKGESVSNFILQVTANQTVNNKAEVPDFEKKLKDKNDSTGEVSDWQDSADYDIGDKIPFKLEGTVASNYADYKGAYKFVFHDKEEDSLTFDPASVKVYVDNTEITNGYTVKTSGLTDGCTFEVVFENLKNIESVGANSKIRVEYESTLNDKAVLGNHGNVNKAKLEFSNNPTSTQGDVPTGETPWDNVIVFTYQIVVNKYANEVADNNKLTGAEFTLEKIMQDGSKKAIAVVKSEDGTKFTFKGLDDGKYVLTETKTPDKYNTIDPITFTVTANHDIEWTTKDRAEVLTSLEGTDNNTIEEGKITFTANNDKSGLSTDIINKSGTILPSTGGIGTRIFYIVGGVLMVGAAVLLIVKRRMSKEN